VRVGSGHRWTVRLGPVDGNRRNSREPIITTRDEH
jgi:hypothetical protein